MSGSLVLVTGSAGTSEKRWCATCGRRGRPACGVDLVASPYTDVVGSIV